MSRDEVQVYVTGGTFDKEYDYITGELFFKNTHLQDMFEQGRCTVNIDIKTLMMVDSLEMTQADIEIILHNCKSTKLDKVIITHGTDRIVETAKALAKEDIAGKTIVLTGAMVPIAFGSSSDGFFNLGSALAFVQSLPEGVYVVMNGRCFNSDEVRKNRQTGYFEFIK